jgi:hypothetical protein
MKMRLIRILKHSWQSEGAAKRAIPPELLEKLAAQVAKSEARHSAEIRIYVETSLPLSDLWRATSTTQIMRERALTMFGKLRVWDTAHNNGVLIYLLLAERHIEISRPSQSERVAGRPSAGLTPEPSADVKKPAAVGAGCF